MTIGSIRIDDGNGVVRMEDTYATARDDLWNALTDPDRLARWIATVAGELREGGLVDATFTSGWEGTLRVDECVPGEHLLITSGVGEPDPKVIEAWLTRDGDKTRLVIEERGFTRDELPIHGAGWQAHIEDLGTYLAGEPRAPWSGRWHELAPEYREKAAEL